MIAGRAARVLASAHRSASRDFVIGDSLGRHRLRLAAPSDDDGEAYIAPAGQHAALRLTATLRFEQWLRGARPARSDPVLTPTSFQRQRLVLLLRIAEARAAAASLRDMAFALVFPHHDVLSGAAWKTSSERRHCLRLLAESLGFSAAGYRNLLTGQVQP